MGFLDDILRAVHLSGGGAAVNGPHGGTAPAAGWAVGGGANPGWAASLTGGSAGWGANLQNQGWAMGGGGNTPPNVLAQNALAKDLGFVQGSNNPQLIGQAQKVASGKTNSHGGFFGNLMHDVSDPLSKAVSVLDFPRAILASGAGELDAALNGQSPSLGRFEHNVADHATTGHILAELEGPKDANSSAGHLNNRILGLIGDVALDPLTYVGGLGEVSKGIDKAVGGLALAAKADKAERDAKAARAAVTNARTYVPGLGDQANAYEQAAKELRDQANKATGNGAVTHETVTKLTRGGVASLEPEEKEALGLRSGIGIGSKAEYRIPLIKGAGIDHLSTYLHELAAGQRDRFAAGAFAKKVMPHYAVRQMITEAVQNGDFKAAHDLTQVMKATPVATGARAAFLNAHGPGLQKSLKQFQPNEMHMLRDALEGVGGTRLDPERVAPVRAALDAMREAANKEGVNIGNLEDYFPHQITDAARKVQGVRRPSKAFSAELARTLRPGDKFLGETLQDGSVSEINRIMNEQGAHDLFNTDPGTVLSTYLHGLAGRVGQQAMANHLADIGVTHSGILAKTPEDWEKILKSGAFSNYGSKAFNDSLRQSRLATEAPPAHEVGDELQRGLTRHGLPPTGDESLAGSGAFKGFEGPDYIKAALEKLAQEKSLAADQMPSKYGQFFDRMLGMWRKLELAAPGKAIRHAITGPAWGHYIGGVDPAGMLHSGRVMQKFLHGAGVKKGLLNHEGIDVEKGLAAIKDPEMRQRMADFMRTGLTHGRAFGHDAKALSFEDFANQTPMKLATSKTRQAIDKVNVPSKYLESSREWQARTQDFSRWMMYNDARNHGLSNLTAAQKTRSILGDPTMGTSFEKNTMRRVVPFYMFMRQQGPAQVKALARTPEKFVDFVNAERNLQEGEQRPGIVPQFYDQTMSMMLPFKEGGNQIFMSPDLPFTRINQQTSSLNQALSNLNPLIQLAIEHATKTNLSTGAGFSPKAQNLPQVDQPIAPLLEALGLASKTVAPQTDFGVTTPAGTYRMTPFDQTLLDTLLPPEGQARRVDTGGEPNMANRSVTTDLSYLLGQNFRSDDPYQQASELYRRDAIIKQLIEQAQNQAILPAYLRGFKK